MGGNPPAGDAAVDAAIAVDSGFGLDTGLPPIPGIDANIPPPMVATDAGFNAIPPNG